MATDDHDAYVAALLADAPQFTAEQAAELRRLMADGRAARDPTPDDDASPGQGDSLS